jgi:hypothetical protein
MRSAGMGKRRPQYPPGCSHRVGYTGAANQLPFPNTVIGRLTVGIAEDRERIGNVFSNQP